MQVELRLAEAQKDGLTAARLRLELAKSIYTLDAQDDYTYAMFVSNRAPTGIGAAPGLIPETVDPMQK